ncbi:MAG: response regulator [Bacillota bacterium]
MARVMVVDDAVFMRSVIKSILVNAGHKIVAEASNGEEALKKYIAYKPDLVTMDITMPDIDGVEGVKRITEFDPAANIIMVSALAQKNLVVKAIRSGAKHYILKPVDEVKVIEVVNEVLRIRNDEENALPSIDDIRASIQCLNNGIGKLDSGVEEIDSTLVEK